MRKNFPNRHKRLLAYSLLTTFIFPAGFYASEAVAQKANAEENQVAHVDFDIPATSLSSALVYFGQQAQIRLSADSSLLSSYETRALKGRFDPMQALDRLLLDTDLAAEKMPDGTVLIKKTTPSKPTEKSSTGTHEMEPIFVYASEADTVGKIILSGDDIQKKYAGDLNSALRSQSGVFTRAPVDQPGLTVNVRGMQGGGRVNVMIDGVPQNFRNVSGHGGTTDPLVYVDPNFVQSVDIKKGQARGADGMGTLSGAVNFRTITASDILLPGRSIGAQLQSEFSGNGTEQSYLASVAGRVSIGETGFADAMAALSYKYVDRYQDGNGTDVPVDSTIDAVREPKSGLFKFNFSPNETHSLETSASFYNNEFLAFTTFSGGTSGYKWLLEKKSANAIYTLTPDNDWINARLKVHLGETYLEFPDNGAGSFSGREGTNLAYGFDLTNINDFKPLENVKVTLEYGAALQADIYEGNAQRGGNPDGELIKTGLFIDSNVEWDKFEVNAGVRYDHWDVEGVRSFTAPGSGSCPPGGDPCSDVEFQKSGGDVNPSIGLSYRPVDGVRLFTRFALSSRAPTTSEMFSSSHDFSGLGTPATNNPELEPEKMRGLDVGFDVKQSNLLSKGDNFSLGVNYFYNEIDNYIGVGVNPTMTGQEYMQAVADAVNTSNFARLAELQNPVFVRQFRNEAQQYQNADETVTMQGIELNAGYDIGRFYINTTASYSETDQPFGDVSVGFGNDIGTQPRIQGVIDIGTRWLDKRLVIGGRMTYTGKSTQARLSEYDLAGAPPNLTVYVKDGGDIDVPAYTLFDLYASFNYSENLEIFGTVENVFDKFYRPANTSSNNGFLWDDVKKVEVPWGGRGRTFKVGAKLRF